MSPACYCQRMLDTSYTGDSAIDSVLRRKYADGSLYSAFFRHVYEHRRFLAGDRDEDTEKNPSAYAERFFDIIESACPEGAHYPTVYIRDLPGGPSYTMDDPEQRQQIEEEYETGMILGSGGRWYDEDESNEIPWTPPKSRKHRRTDLEGPIPQP